MPMAAARSRRYAVFSSGLRGNEGVSPSYRTMIVFMPLCQAALCTFGLSEQRWKEHLKRVRDAHRVVLMVCAEI